MGIAADTPEIRIAPLQPDYTLIVLAVKPPLNHHVQPFVGFIPNDIYTKCIYIYMYIYILIWSRPPSLHPPWVGGGHYQPQGGKISYRGIWIYIYMYVSIMLYIKHILYVPKTTKYYIQKT